MTPADRHLECCPTCGSTRWKTSRPLPDPTHEQEKLIPTRVVISLTLVLAAGTLAGLIFVCA